MVPLVGANIQRSKKAADSEQAQDLKPACLGYLGDEILSSYIMLYRDYRY